MKRIEARITGRVQGVGFRFFIQDLASTYSLFGWVRNTPDGNVELEAEGDDRDISIFSAEVRKGPPLSHVSNVRIIEKPVYGTETGFEVRY